MKRIINVFVVVFSLFFVSLAQADNFNQGLGNNWEADEEGNAVQYFKLRLIESATIQISLTSESIIDYELEVLDQNLDPLEGISDISIPISLAAGTYYIVASATEIINSLAFILNVSADIDASNVFFNESYFKNIIGAWELSGGKNSNSSQNPIYKITAENYAGQATLTLNSADSYNYLYLLDSNFEVLHESSETEEFETTASTLSFVLAAQTYYVVAATEYSNQSAIFQLTLLVEEPTLPITFEDVINEGEIGVTATINFSDLDNQYGGNAEVYLDINPTYNAADYCEGFSFDFTADEFNTASNQNMSVYNNCEYAVELNIYEYGINVNRQTGTFKVEVDRDGNTVITDSTGSVSADTDSFIIGGFSGDKFEIDFSVKQKLGDVEENFNIDEKNDINFLTFNSENYPAISGKLYSSINSDEIHFKGALPLVAGNYSYILSYKIYTTELELNDTFETAGETNALLEQNLVIEYPQPSVLVIQQNGNIQISLENNANIGNIINVPTNGELSEIDGIIFYTPTDEFVGEDEFTYLVDNELFVVSIDVKQTAELVISISLSDGTTYGDYNLPDEFPVGIEGRLKIESTDESCPNFDEIFVATSNSAALTMIVMDGCSYTATLFGPLTYNEVEEGYERSQVNSVSFDVIKIEDGNVTINYDGSDTDTLIIGGSISFGKGTIDLHVQKIVNDMIQEIGIVDDISFTLKNDQFSDIEVNAVIVKNDEIDEVRIQQSFPLVTSAYSYELTYETFTKEGSFAFGGETSPFYKEEIKFAINAAPVTQNLTINTVEDNVVTFELDATDSDNDDLIYSLVDQSNVKNGDLNLEQIQDGKVTYTPNPNLYCAGDGCDTFTYKVNDGTSDSNIATVTLTVTAVNDAPVSDLLNTAVIEDTPKEITLSASDIDSNDLTYITVLNPTNGTLGQIVNNTVTYTPNLHFSGSDSFSYKANDGLADSNVSIVAITVSPVNDVPVAVPTAISVNEDSAQEILLSASDSDGDSLTYDIITEPSQGILSDKLGNKVTYTPFENYHGTDVFTFKVNDGTVDSALASVTITVESINDAPTTTPSNVTTTEDVAKEIVLSADDIDNDQLVYSIETDPVSGVLSEIVAGKVTYTPNSNFNGNDTFVFKVSDGIAESNLSTVSIVVKADNDAPVAMDSALNTAEDVALNIELLATDGDGDLLTFNIVQTPSSGTLSLLDGNKTVYSPNNNYFGTDSFSYRVNDGISDSNIATVTIEVSSVNDAPAITSNPIESASSTKNYSYKLTANDVDSETFSFIAKTKPNWLTLVDGVLSGTPLQADIGEHAVVIELSDDGEPKETVTQSFTIEVSEYVRKALQITAPPDVVLEASGSLTAVELGEPEIKSEGDIQVTTSVDQTGPFAVGEYMLVWTATEDGNNTVTDSQKITIKDTTAPLFDSPDLIEIEATGEFTDITAKLNLMATDLVDGNVEVELISNNLQKSGLQPIMVSATDSHGNQAELLVQVAIHPQILLGMDKVAEKGANVTIPLQLNGTAAILPITINYQIDSAGQLTDGEFVIESDSGEPLVITLADNLLAGEQVTLKLISAQNAVLTNNKTLAISLIDSNFAPTLKVDLYQSDLIALVVDQTAGQIELKASVHDINSSDIHNIVWLDSDSNELGNGLTLTLDPMTLNIGKNTVVVTVTESNTSDAYSIELEKVLWVVDSLAILTDVDSDGDGISDIDEGYGDKDGDGIPDFEDAISSPNELPVSGGIRKLQAPVGIQLSLGSTIQQKSGGLGSSAGLTQEELVSMFGLLAIDEEYSLTLPLIDFVASGLNQQGDSVTLIIALAEGQVLPENALYRKFSVSTGWRNFVSDSANSIASALADTEGNCPSSDSALFEEGLNAGYQCIALTIQDGGANDDDALANAIVTDPGAIVVVAPNLPAQIVVTGNESVNEGEMLTLDATGTTDPEGKPLTFLWQQLSGPEVILTNSNSAIVKLTAPDVASDEQIELQLTVSDGKNNSLWTNVIALVFVNQLPELSLSASSSSVVEKESVTLTATASDLDGQTLSYLWEQVSGPSVNLGAANTAQLNFNMPEVDENSKLVFRVSVFDGSDTITQYINIIVVNKEGGVMSIVALLCLFLFYSLVRLKEGNKRHYF